MTYFAINKMKIFLLFTFAAFIYANDLCNNHVFNWNFYLSHNKDLIRTGYNGPNGACSHWKSKGANEGRQAHPRFHTLQYCENYPDLRNIGYCNRGEYSMAVNHYLDDGFKEGRLGYNNNGNFGTWTASNKRITILASALHGGSISSVVYDDIVECANSYDRGRQLQFAFSDNSGEEIGRASCRERVSAPV